MDVESIREYCLAKPGTTEEFPFDESTLVLKVMGKMFGLVSLTRMPLSLNLKCDPDRAEELRERYQAILPGYHMNKKHWNTIILEEDVNGKVLANLIDHSYELVVSKLTKKLKAELSQF